MNSIGLLGAILVDGLTAEVALGLGADIGHNVLSLAAGAGIGRELIGIMGGRSGYCSKGTGLFLVCATFTVQAGVNVLGLFLGGSLVMNGLTAEVVVQRLTNGDGVLGLALIAAPGFGGCVLAVGGGRSGQSQLTSLFLGLAAAIYSTGVDVHGIGLIGSAVMNGRVPPCTRKDSPGFS